MDHQPASIDFAFIGHQDSWVKVQLLVNSIRKENAQSLMRVEQIKEVYSYIPPRPLFELDVFSTKSGWFKGVYIDTFITPDELDVTHLHTNIKKVKEACDCAVKLKTPIVALGGLTSIVLESGSSSFARIENTFFTTGNALTAAFIVKAIENSLKQTGASLKFTNILIIGSTGDIGSACVSYFAGKVNQILLNARQALPLQKQASHLLSIAQQSIWSINLNDLLPHADVVICAASSFLQNCNTSLLPAHSIICDAGYPKNLSNSFSGTEKKLFLGGLGLVKGGFHTRPSIYKDFYKFPANDIAHGCLLEAIVLAMEKRHLAYSAGRGNIDVHNMEEIFSLANQHGIETAPQFDTTHCWDTKNQTNYYEDITTRTSTTF